MRPAAARPVLPTGYGLSAAFIAEALDANSNGAMVFTYEPLSELPLAAQRTSKVRRHGHRAPQSAGDPLLHLVDIDSGSDFRNDDIREWLTNGYQGLVLSMTPPASTPR